MNSEEACEDACFARSDCTAVSFNPGSECTLILWTGEILSNGAGSFTCKLRNPYYKTAPSINYEDKIGKCVIKASQLEPTLKSEEVGLYRPEQCKEVCDNKVCWAYQYNKEYFRCTTYTETAEMDGKYTITENCYVK